MNKKTKDEIRRITREINLDITRKQFDLLIKDRAIKDKEEQCKDEERRNTMDRKTEDLIVQIMCFVSIGLLLLAAGLIMFNT